MPTPPALPRRRRRRRAPAALSSSAARPRAPRVPSESMARGAYSMDLGRVDYLEAWDLQRSLAAAVSQGAIPDIVLFLEHPPTITLGRRTEENEVHVPDAADVAVVETD